MKRWPLLLLLVAGGSIFLWLVVRRSGPVEVAFSKARTEPIVSVLSTNGQVEPASWEAVYSEREGRLTQLSVVRGQSVRRGETLGVLSSPESASEIAAAQSRVAQAQAALATIEQGGAQRELAEIESSLRSNQLSRDTAQRELEALQRLVDKQAATQFELTQARDKVQSLTAEREALQRRKAALVDSNDAKVARARLTEAQQSLSFAQRQAGQAQIQAPVDGVVYDLAAHSGDWISPGTLFAKIGKLDPLRVTIYVDEPDLGRVHQGQNVKITWDAITGASWNAVLEKVPTEVTALGSRMVGRAIALAANPDGRLLPGANVIVEIRAQEVSSAVTIPKAALRRTNGQNGVYRLEGNRLQWRPIELGISSVTRSEVKSGLAAGDAVALPTETTLRDGMEVKAVYR